jgi:hypothetical protein
MVDDSEKYRMIDQAFSQKKTFRVAGMPKDAFLVAVLSHRARLDNILRAPGLNLAEKELLKQRKINLVDAKKAYHAKQAASLSVDA